MDSLKMLGLAAVAAMALMVIAGAGSASATTLTCTNPPGTKVTCPVGTELDASVEGGTTRLTAGGVTITCATGTVKGKVENAGSATETVSGKTTAVTVFDCPSCSAWEVTNGTLEFHTENNGGLANSNGTLTGNGFTVHTVCFGITCNYITGNNKHLGTLTGSSTTKVTATFDISTELEKESGSFLCNNLAAWEGSYTVTSPDWLDVE